MSSTDLVFIVILLLPKVIIPRGFIGSQVFTLINLEDPLDGGKASVTEVNEVSRVP
jgi:hypothetical protein